MQWEPWDEKPAAVKETNDDADGYISEFFNSPEATSQNLPVGFPCNHSYLCFVWPWKNELGVVRITLPALIWLHFLFPPCIPDVVVAISEPSYIYVTDWT